jgi:hypothetical protein
MTASVVDRLRRLYAAVVARGDRCTALLIRARLCAECSNPDCAASQRRSCAGGRVAA